MRYAIILFMAGLASCTPAPHYTFTDYYQACTVKMKKAFNAEQICTMAAFNACPAGGDCFQ